MSRIFIFLILITLSGCAYRKPVENRYLVLEREHPKEFKKLIVIDPGHGGKDEGASEKPCEEKILTLKTSKLLKSHLKQLGYRVILTREKDAFVPLDERCALANDMECALFVSVHFNHAENKEARGLEVYYYDDEENKERAKQSKTLAECIQTKILSNTEITSRGIKKAEFRVIRNTQMPAVLVEGGFLSHIEEKRMCNDPSYQDALALGIAHGIDEYLCR